MIIAKKITIEQVNLQEMEKIKALRESGLFDMESGRVEVNIHNGQIQNIVIHKTTYRREKTML